MESLAKEKSKLYANLQFWSNSLKSRSLLNKNAFFANLLSRIPPLFAGFLLLLLRRRVDRSGCLYIQTNLPVKVDMANLYQKQTKVYKKSRPIYPEELFQFIASKTPAHYLVWDAGTGSGQAAASLAEIFENVIATDTSQGQLELAPKLPNIQYHHTPPSMSKVELQDIISGEGTIDLVTIAQAMHWFNDLPAFFQQVKWVLKKPHGVIATWCYLPGEVNDKIDSVLRQIYFVSSRPYWDKGRHMIVDKYQSIDFPFEPVDGFDHTGPFEFKTEKLMNLADYVSYIESASAYQTARDNGVELLTKDVIQELKDAWNEDGNGEKVVKFPVYLRIGKVGHSI